MLFKSVHLRVCHTFATKLQAASTKNKKDSAGKRLGVKVFGGEVTYPNDVLIRQRGMKWKAGLNTHRGVDHTIHSKIEGVTKFTKEYEGTKKVTTIHVIPKHGENKKHRPPMPYTYHPELYPELAVYNSEPIAPYVKTNLASNDKKPRTDLPKKVGTSQTLFGITLPKRYTENHAIEERSFDKEQVDSFEEYENEIKSRYETISEQLKKYE